MLILFVAAALGASHSVALTPFNAVEADKTISEFSAELLAQELEKRGVKTMTPRAISAAIGNDRQKQLMGCSESCVIELAGALGVDGLVLGDLARLGTDWALNVRVVGASNAQTIASFNERTASSEGLPLMVERAAWNLAGQLSRAGWAEANPGSEPSARYSRAWALVPAVIGVAGLALGVVMELQASAQFEAIKTASADQVRLVASQGRSNETIGTIALSVGAAGVIAAVVVFILGDSGHVVPVAWVTPASGGFGIAGVLP